MRPPGQHTVTMQIRRRRAGQHDAWPVVAGKHRRPLDRAGRDDDTLRPHQPEPFARQIGVGSREMIGHAFGQSDHVAGIPAKRGRAGQDRRARVERRGDPVRRGHPIDSGSRPGQQRTARFRLLIAEDHAFAARRGRRGGGQTGGTGADHQHVAMGVTMQIPVGIGGVGAVPSPAAARMAGSYRRRQNDAGHMKVL